MNIVSLIKRLLGKGKNGELQAMEYALSHGFTHGNNFHYNTGYPIDANYPWLITVGDDVTLATGVKLLAHDASTTRIGGGGQNENRNC